MELLYIEDKKQIEAYTDEIWDICQRVYEPIGGFLSFQKKEDIPKRVHLLKIVNSTDKDGNPAIGACALYRDVSGTIGIPGEYLEPSYKGVAYAGNRGVVENYRECLDLIIHDDIASLENWFWVDASGALEHLFIKQGGVLIPNIYVAKLSCRTIPDEDLMPDGIHYNLLLGQSNPVKVKKCMFGFPTKDAYDSILKLYHTVDNFTQTAKNLLHGTTQVSSLPRMESEGANSGIPRNKLHGALWYIYYLDECCYNNEFNEVPSEWIDLLNESMELLNKYYPAIRCASVDRIMDSGRELQNKLSPLVFHQIKNLERPSHKTL